MDRANPAYQCTILCYHSLPPCQSYRDGIFESLSQHHSPIVSTAKCVSHHKRNHSFNAIHSLVPRLYCPAFLNASQLAYSSHSSVYSSDNSLMTPPPPKISPALSPIVCEVHQKNNLDDDEDDGGRQTKPQGDCAVWGAMESPYTHTHTHTHTHSPSERMKLLPVGMKKKPIMRPNTASHLNSQKLQAKRGKN